MCSRPVPEHCSTNANVLLAFLAPRTKRFDPRLPNEFAQPPNKTPEQNHSGCGLPEQNKRTKRRPQKQTNEQNKTSGPCQAPLLLALARPRTFTNLALTLARLRAWRGPGKVKGPRPSGPGEGLARALQNLWPLPGPFLPGPRRA